MKIVSIASLGLCEYCGILLSIQNMPTEALDAIWACPDCGKKLTCKSFGYDQYNKRIKWVGPDGKWVNQEPEKRFRLGNFDVITAEEMRLMMTSQFLR